MIDLLPSFLGILVGIFSIVTAVIAILSTPYRRRLTSVALGGGIIAFALTMLGRIISAFLPKALLYEHPLLLRSITLGPTLLNSCGYLLLVFGVTLYFLTDEARSVEPNTRPPRRMARSMRLNIGLGAAGVIVTALGIFFSLPLLKEYQDKKLILMSPPRLSIDGTTKFAIKNFSNVPIQEVVVTFHGYLDDKITFTPRAPAFPIEIETPNPRAVFLERVYTIELGKLQPDCGVIVSIARDEQVREKLALLTLPSRSLVGSDDQWAEHPFTEPMALRAWHNQGSIPITDDVKILTVKSDFGTVYTIRGMWELKEVSK